MSGKKRPLKYFIRGRSLEPKTVGWRTICEVHRNILKIVDDEIKPKDEALAARLSDLVEECYDLGKRMDAKLRENSVDYMSQVYIKNSGR